MKSYNKQTNSLINKGDTIIVKSPLPINSKETVILGYEVITEDIIDFNDFLIGYFAISIVSKDLNINENELVWHLLNKDNFGENKEFIDLCAKQTESYYIYFKFIKSESSGQIINISKINLKIQDSENKQNINEEYPYFKQSIFGEDNLYDENILKWHYNVLEKVSGKNILPNYIQRDKDFSVFWGWITHLFAVIVNFSRKFLNIFKDYKNNLGLVHEFLKQRNYYQDSRVEIDRDLKVYSSQEIIYSPEVNSVFENNYPFYPKDYFEFSNNNRERALPPSNPIVILRPYTDLVSSGYIRVHEGDNLILECENDTLLTSITSNNVNVYYYSKYYNFIFSKSFNFHSEKKIIKTKIENFENSEEIYYIIVNFNNNISRGINEPPSIVKIFIEGSGNYVIKERTEEEIFSLQKIFKNRGTNKSIDLIKKVLETKKEDAFYANYLNHKEIGWFLNRNCPFNGSLREEISINSLFIKNKIECNNGLFLEYQNSYLILNQNTSFKITFPSTDKKINKVKVFCSFITKNGKQVSVFDKNIIFGNWKVIKNLSPFSLSKVKDNEENIIVKDLENTFKPNDILIDDFVRYKLVELIESKFKEKGLIELIPKYKNNICSIELPIILIDNENYSKLNTLEYDINDVKDLFFIAKNTLDGEEFSYLVIDGVFLEYDSAVENSSEQEDNILIGCSLKNLDKKGTEIINPNHHTLKFIYNKDTNSLSDVLLGYEIENGENFVKFAYTNTINSYEFTEEEKRKGYKIIRFKSYYDNIDYGSIIVKYPNKSVNLENIILKNANVEYQSIVTNVLDIYTNLVFRKLPFSLGFLNNAQYFLCLFRNNGIYDDNEVKEIISQKIIPYNGYRLFIDNSIYKSNIFKLLQFKNISIEGGTSFKATTRILNVQVKGGIPKYTYEILDYNTKEVLKSLVSMNTIYSVEIKFGIYLLRVKDSLGNIITNVVNVEKLNSINYKLKIYIGIDNSIQLSIYIFGGTEKYYNVSYNNNNSNKVIPYKIWTSISDLRLNEEQEGVTIEKIILDTQIDSWIVNNKIRPLNLKELGIFVYDESKFNQNQEEAFIRKIAFKDLIWNLEYLQRRSKLGVYTSSILKEVGKIYVFYPFPADSGLGNGPAYILEGDSNSNFILTRIDSSTPFQGDLKIKSNITLKNEIINDILIQDIDGDFQETIDLNNILKNVAIDYYDNSEGYCELTD